MVMLPTSWTHFIPDCNRSKLLSYPFTIWGEKKTETQILYYLVEGIIYEIQEWCELAENNSFCRTIPFNHEPNFFPLEPFKPVSIWSTGKCRQSIKIYRFTLPKNWDQFFSSKTNYLRLLRRFLLEFAREGKIVFLYNHMTRKTELSNEHRTIKKWFRPCGNI